MRLTSPFVDISWDPAEIPTSEDREAGPRDGLTWEGEACRALSQATGLVELRWPPHAQHSLERSRNLAHTLPHLARLEVLQARLEEPLQTALFADCRTDGRATAIRLLIADVPLFGTKSLAFLLDVLGGPVEMLELSSYELNLTLFAMIAPRFDHLSSIECRHAGDDLTVLVSVIKSSQVGLAKLALHVISVLGHDRFLPELLQLADSFGRLRELALVIPDFRDELGSLEDAGRSWQQLKQLLFAAPQLSSLDLSFGNDVLGDTDENY